MYFNEGLNRALIERDDPIITEYEFYVLGKRLHEQGSWAGQTLSRPPDAWDLTSVKNALRRLNQRSAVATDDDFKSGVWRVVQSTQAGSAEEIACIADPFCYVSHLSAMQRYGLTDRSPEALHLTTPTREVWNRLRDEKVARDLGSDAGRPSALLRKPGLRGGIRRRAVTLHESRHPARPTEVSGERTRITSIGRTFVDTLSEPHLCGGMRHVVDVWTREADVWAQDIIAAADAIESVIVKMRAGYLLSEVMEIEDKRIDAWASLAQRGGSRKLDPEKPYAAAYSERWMISLNV